MGHRYAFLDSLESSIRERLSADPAESYVASLVNSDNDETLKKIGEEAIEVILASKNADAAEICAESADLLFHLMIMLAQHQLSLENVVSVLEERSGVSGLQKKALRSFGDSG